MHTWFHCCIILSQSFVCLLDPKICITDELPKVVKSNLFARLTVVNFHTVI